MKNKCTVIQIDGLRGLLILGFVVMCAVAGFIIFPAWCCQHAWNFIAGYVMDMPLMELKHGAMLWLIIALVSYVTLFNKFKIAFVSAKDADMIGNMRSNMTDDEILNAIEKRIQERRAQIKNVDKPADVNVEKCVSAEQQESQDIKND